MVHRATRIDIGGLSWRDKESKEVNQRRRTRPANDVDQT